MTLDEAVTYFTEEAERRKRMSQLDGSFVSEARNEQEKRIHAEAAKNNRQLAEWLTELKEAKLLLKSAVEDFSEIKSYLSEPYSHLCDKWRYENEALKLIES